MASRADSLRIKIAGVEVVQLTAIGTVPGVVVRLAAAANGPGRGILRYDSGTLAWQPPGAAEFGVAVDVPADGEYLVEGVDDAKWIRVEVYHDFLPETATDSRVDLADRYNGLGGDDVSAAEAAAGAVETYTLALTNATAAAVSDIRARLDAAMAGLEISADGTTWSAPTTEAAAISLGDLAAAASTTLYLRRTIAAGAAAQPAVLRHLHFSFFVSA